MNDQRDVVVIGGGVIGVCAAYYLLTSGRQVTVLERDAICSGSSYGNAGLLVPSHSIPLAAPGAIAQGLKWMFNPESPFYIKPRFDRELFSWLWRFRAAANERRMRNAVPVITQFSKASLALYHELIAQEELDCNFAHKGTLSLYRTERGLEDGLEEAHILAGYDISFQRFSPAELREMEPTVRTGMAGGIHFRDDAHLKPDEFVQGLASRFESRGGVIETGVEVVGFETSARGVDAVKTTQGDYPCRQVVLATGAWSPGVARDLRLRLPLQAAKGYSVTVEAPETSPEIPLMLGEARVGVTPMGKVLRLAGTLELSGMNLDISTRRVDALVKAARQYLSVDVDAEAGEVWCGMRPLSPDGLPIIGSAGPMANVIVATGHSMTGVTLGPATGKLVAQLANEEMPVVDPGPFSPARFQ